MQKPKVLSILVALAALLLTAPAASASTEAGWDCVADDTEADWTVLVAGGSFYPMPPSIPPEGPKVITRWTVKVGPGLGPLPQRLEVFDIQNEQGDYKKIGESLTETLAAGTNSFPTRIPAGEGDSVGLYGPAGTLVCQGNGTSWLFKGSAATGETKNFEPLSIAAGTPLVVTVEDDRDGDGYGDETQDGCPASAAYQGDCPTVKPEVSDVITTRSAILVKAKVASEAAVKAFGFVKWRTTPGPGGKAQASKKPTNVIAGLSSGSPQSLAAGVVTTFRLLLPKVVKRRLQTLSAKSKLRARITVRATDLAGRNADRKLVVNLRGRSKGA